ncbi:hypothetical protein DK849_02885 [Metamycoplasma cloacale]|uniref:Uncharacterized protein n=2 Tax=Metamycoplasma cloacale TaxID=92401 RepID=A0A2Z4LMJ5_9BACT|nr:hypothetical protein DK849_02885 [Metamycoplasma cloacale]
MIPSNHIDIWSDISGEIRPAGRNDYSVWTPNKLRNFLLKKSAIIVDDIVKISSKNLLPRIQRGSSGKISGYKINPLFFVRVEDIVIEKDLMIFKLNKVRQLNPTIAAKIFLKKTTNYKALKLEYDL